MNIIEILKYFDEIQDENLKYIVKSMLDEANPKTKQQLAEELGIAPATVVRRFNKAIRIMQSKYHEVQYKLKKEAEEKYILSCYDEDGYLSLVKIADAKGIDALELRQAFEDYVKSLTFEEIGIAHRFGFSLEAEKLGNTQILRHRVRGFSQVLCNEYEKDLLDKMDRQLLLSVDRIYSNFKKSKTTDDKIIQ